MGQLAEVVSTYDPVTVTLGWGHAVTDPFRSVSLQATFTGPGGSTTVAGFVDRQDGSGGRARFMPTVPGEYTYRLEATGAANAVSEGAFTVVQGSAKGLLQTDGWHFRWSATGEPFFWNATTAYLLAGLDLPVALRAVDRLADAGINRLRVSLSPTRQADGGRWYEPQVQPREDFTFQYGPWLAAQPDSQTEPRFDTTRFDVSYWQKFEQILDHARQRDVVVQVIFFTDAQEPQNYPFNRRLFGNDPDEIRYYEYAVARLAAFSNVEWCLTNEWALYRPDEWVEARGEHLSRIDPYGHLLSVHGHGHFPFMASPWCTHSLWQVWDEHGSGAWVADRRREQAATGRIIPVVNEEYGYEDHYPGPWGEGRVAPARNADSRRRLAWEITFAGGHQTTGESAANGLGGWINGLGDDTMTLPALHGILRRFFERFDFTRLEPRGPHRLENPDDTILVYQPVGGAAPEFPPDWRIAGFNPATGEDTHLPPTDGGDFVWIAHHPHV